MAPTSGRCLRAWPRPAWGAARGGRGAGGGRRPGVVAAEPGGAGRGARRGGAGGWVLDGARARGRGAARGRRDPVVARRPFGGEGSDDPPAAATAGSVRSRRRRGP